VSRNRKVVLAVVMGLLMFRVIGTLVTYAVQRPRRTPGLPVQRSIVSELGGEATLPNRASAFCQGALYQCVCGPGGATMKISVAKLVLSRETSSPGQTIAVTGVDFAPGTSVALCLGVPNAGLSKQNLAVVVADAHGAFEVALTLPTEWPGAQRPIVERDLVIAAVDEALGQTLAVAQLINEGALERGR
jgi:hypothetical protein